MQLHNILITNSTGSSSSSHPTSENDSIIELAGGNITALLTDFLSSGQIPRGTSINLILDQSFIRYQYFSFPLISARKIHQVLQFELEDVLLQGAENYVYSYISQSSKKSGITEAGVFTIEKQLLDELISVFKLFSLDLRWITSLENLMDLTYREKGDWTNGSVIVDLSGNSLPARFFIYQNGFLTGISALYSAQMEAGESATAKHLSDQLNQKLNAIMLAKPGVTETYVSGQSCDEIQIKDPQLTIGSKNQSSDGIAKKQRECSADIRLDHPRRINLIQSNLLIIQELKKYSRSLIITAGILLLSLALYMAAVAYRGYNNHLAMQTLEKRLTTTISRYLPKGTSKTNAVYILKERVQDIELEKEKNRNFERRHYQVSRTLTDLSLLKEKIPSLTLSRFSLNEQVIRFQGKIESISKFDQFQEALTRLYPADSFRVNTSEKNRGTGTVEFSTTIQRKLKP